MKRKIICIGIISLFLLSGLTALGMESGETKLQTSSDEENIVDFGEIMGYEKVKKGFFRYLPDFYIENKETVLENWDSSEPIIVKMSAYFPKYSWFYDATVADIEITAKLNDNDFTNNYNVLLDDYITLMVHKGTNYREEVRFAIFGNNFQKGDTIYIEAHLRGQLLSSRARMTLEADKPNDPNNVAICSFIIN